LSPVAQPNLSPWLAEKVLEHGGKYALDSKVRVFTEAPDFFDLNVYDVIVLEGRHYLIRGHEYEQRFSLEEVPKYWVKRAVELETGAKKIIKFVFHESFEDKLGGVTIKYVRSPEKEGRVLDIVRGHPNFMQGLAIIDPQGNNIRVIDRIHGRQLDQIIEAIQKPHEQYFHEDMPRIARDCIAVFAAIGHLHKRGEKHGDIRRDHIMVEHGTNVYKWIDFDLDYYEPEHPFGVDIFGLGNVLLFVAGKRIHTVADVYRERPEVYERLTEEDVSPVLRNRVVNLKKIYPYVPDVLNNVLLHFSNGADVFYDSVDEMLHDLGDCLAKLPS